MPFRSFFGITKRIYKGWTVQLSLMTALMVVVGDYFSGKAIGFPIAYVLPVGMAAWQGNKVLAYLLATLLPCCRIAFHFLWHERDPLPVAIINACITAFALTLYAYMLDRIAQQKQQLEKKVRVLEGILPVCASCKRIRNGQGHYQQIETYISERSDISFSHGICPECAQKLYPEFYNDTPKNKIGTDPNA